MQAYTRIIYEGLWKNNPGFVQLLGLCPLLAVTGSLVNGLGLGLATTLILLTSSGLVSLLRSLIPAEIRLPVFVLIIAASVTMLELIMKAFYYELYLVLGIFISLIVTNCIIIGRVEAFAVKNSLGSSLLDALSMGLGATMALTLLGALRELLGHGTLFAQADLMFGESAAWLTVTVIEDYRGWLLAALPPGAFIGLGLLIALKNGIDRRLKKATPVATPGVNFVSATHASQ